MHHINLYETRDSYVSRVSPKILGELELRANARIEAIIRHSFDSLNGPDGMFRFKAIFTVEGFQKARAETKAILLADYRSTLPDRAKHMAGEKYDQLTLAGQNPNKNEKLAALRMAWS